MVVVELLNAIIHGVFLYKGFGHIMRRFASVIITDHKDRFPYPDNHLLWLSDAANSETLLRSASKSPLLTLLRLVLVQLHSYPSPRPMMASFMSYFGGRRDPKQTARDAIVTLRQQLQMIEKKEEYLQKKIDEEVKKAKANAVSNKTGMWCAFIGIPFAYRS